MWEFRQLKKPRQVETNKSADLNFSNIIYDVIAHLIYMY